MNVLGVGGDSITHPRASEREGDEGCVACNHSLSVCRKLRDTPAASFFSAGCGWLPGYLSSGEMPSAMAPAGSGPEESSITVGKANWRKQSIRMPRKSIVSKSTKKLNVLRRVGSGEMPLFQAGLFQLKAVLEEMPKAEDFREQQAMRAKEKKRNHLLHEVLEEILDTERNYLQDLRFINKEFTRPLKEVMEHLEHYDVFSNIEQLEQLHATIEADLQPARAEAKAADGSTDELARKVVVALQPNIPLLMSYAIYCGKFTDAPERLALARHRNKRVDAVATRAAAEFNTALEALLFRPVQRMCVYPLLFKQALKYLPENDPDLDDSFRTCFAEIEKTIKQVNENVRQQEAVEHLRDLLTEQVVGAAHLFNASRRLALEMAVTVRRLDGWLPALEPRRVCKLFLLSDCILVARRSKKGGAHKRLLILPLEELDVAMNGGSRTGAPEAADADADAGGSGAQDADSDDANAARRRWVRATRWVLAEERRKSMAGVGAPAASATGSAAGAAPTKRIGVGSAVWSNLLTIAEGQIQGDPVPWKPDDDIFGEHESDSLTIIHHGKNSGGVFKVWTASKSESARLVRRIETLQEELHKLDEEMRKKAEAQRERVTASGRASSFSIPARRQSRAKVVIIEQAGVEVDPFEAARQALRGTSKDSI